jgi:nucleotide-binding universal stress UspA family protein
MEVSALLPIDLEWLCSTNDGTLELVRQNIWLQSAYPLIRPPIFPFFVPIVRPTHQYSFPLSSKLLFARSRGCERSVRMSSFDAVAGVGLKSILVAFDFSEASDKALRHALAIARHYRAKFYFAHVVSHLGYTIAGPEALQLAVEKTWRDTRQLEQELLGRGALDGLQYEFIVREGNIWEQLELVIREKQVDLVVIGTHGRGGLGKLLLGSTAEQIFRHADCFVDTVGPGSYQDSLVEKTQSVRPFLFATDFGAASLHALPYAISLASHFGARLVVLHVLPAAPIPEGFHWSNAGDLLQMRDKARMACERRLEELTVQCAPKAVQPEFLVEFGIASDQILLASHTLKTDLIILGLNRPPHIETASHMPWAIAYKVVCGAHCPVLTIRN